MVTASDTLIVHRKALEAAGKAITLVVRVPAPLKSSPIRWYDRQAQFLQTSQRVMDGPAGTGSTTSG